MRLLLDTHALLWWHEEGPLEAAASAAISDRSNVVLVSAASIWEIAVKVARGRLEASTDEVIAATRDRGLAELAIGFEHAQRAGQLPPHHRDPFDRMLIAQAQLEGLTIVTRDPAIRRYEVATLPA